MKKKFVLVLMAGLFILSGCATIPRQPISQGDFTDLKGRWEGIRDMTFGRTRIQTYAEMEIFNDTLPFKGTITVSLVEPGDKRAYPFDNGGIDPEGNFVAKLTDEIKLVLGLYKGPGEKKLYGSIYQPGGGGVIRLIQKR